MQAIYKKKVEKIINQSTSASYFIKKISLSKDILKIEFYDSFNEYRNNNPAKNKVAPSGADEFLLWFGYKKETGINILDIYKTFFKIAFDCLSKTDFLTKIEFILPIKKTQKIYISTVDYPILKRVIENEDFKWITEKNYETKK